VLLDALSTSSDSAVGPDDIHYQMLKHPPSEAVNTLLSILSDIWLTCNFPSSWRQSYVVPIPKPGKDTTGPIVLLLLPAVSTRLWNVWSITDSCGTWEETKLSLPHRVASVKVEAPQTSLYKHAWSLLFERVLFRSNTSLLFSLFLKRRMIQRWSLAFYTLLVYGADSHFS